MKVYDSVYLLKLISSIQRQGLVCRIEWRDITCETRAKKIDIHLKKPSDLLGVYTSYGTICGHDNYTIVVCSEEDSEEIDYTAIPLYCIKSIETLKGGRKYNVRV